MTNSKAQQEGNEPIAAAVTAWMDGLVLGEPTQAGALEIVPVLWSGAKGAVDLLAHQALADGGLEVLEKDGGVVQELLAFSKSPLPVVILEGETLVGAKQNRMVAHTVVLGPGMKVVIPVGCMEQGRWHMRSSRFAAGVSYASAPMRRDSKKDVMAARKSGRMPSLDQSRLWSQVEEHLAQEGVRSETSDFHRVLEERACEAAPRVANIRPLPDQVGVMAVHDGAFVSLELAGHPETWRQMSERVLTSLAYADAGGRRGRRPTREWLTAVRDAARGLKARPAVGLGCDVEIEAGELIGSGVWMGDRFAHLSVFATA